MLDQLEPFKQYYDGMLLSGYFFALCGCGQRHVDHDDDQGVRGRVTILPGTHIARRAAIRENLHNMYVGNIVKQISRVVQIIKDLVFSLAQCCA